MIVTKAVKEYFIRSYECDAFGNLRIVTMMNIFQDIADKHAFEIGVGMDFCQKHGLAWIGANYYILINKFPQIHQKIKVFSWPSAEKKLGAYRDYEIQNEDGETLIRASCQWILIDFAKRRPVSLRDHLPAYDIISERAVDTDFPKIRNLAHTDYEIDFKIRFDDIDFNKHVNNAIYPLWASEALPMDYRSKHIPQQIEISFKKEALLGDNVHIQSEIEAKETVHVITAASDGRELSRILIKWTELSA